MNNYSKEIMGYKITAKKPNGERYKKHCYTIEELHFVYQECIGLGYTQIRCTVEEAIIFD